MKMNYQINKKNYENYVSVIVCFLDAKSFIQEAIESIFAQTYNNWGLLLIDDGSTDGSTEIAHQYAEQYPQKVIYIDHDNHKNLGLPVSRNLGINKSDGEYIAFLDADDVWLPQKLEQQIAIMNAYPEIAMVYGPAIYWNSWKGKPNDEKKDALVRFKLNQEEYNTIIKPPTLLRRWVKHLQVELGPSGLMARLEVVKRLGGFEESIAPVLEDQSFYCKIFLEEPVFISSQCWYKYRLHKDSISSVGALNREQRVLASRCFWKWVTQYLVNKGIKDKEILSMLEVRCSAKELQF